MKFRLIGAVMALAGAMIGFCMTSESFAKDKQTNIYKLEVQQVDQPELSAVYVTDAKTRATVSVVNSHRDGTFVALYDNVRRRDSRPKLAVSHQGLQLRKANGELIWLTLYQLETMAAASRPIESAGSPNPWLPSVPAGN